MLSGDKVLFNDMLGNTLGVKDQDSYHPIKMTAFGESDNVDAFFTGKPLEECTTVADWSGGGESIYAGCPWQIQERGRISIL